MKFILSYILILLFLPACIADTNPDDFATKPVLYTLSVVSNDPNVASTALRVTVGQTLQLAAIANYDNHQSYSVTNSVNWGSNNPDVATVDRFGLVTGLHAGVCLITASIDNKTRSVQLIVGHMLKLTDISISLAPSLLTLGSTLKFSAVGRYSDGTVLDITPTVTWNTSDISATAALVFNNGAPGQAVIINGGFSGVTASKILLNAEGNAQQNLISNTVYVVSDLAYIVINPDSGSYLVGNTSNFTAIGHFAHNANLEQDLTNYVNWQSSNPNVLSFSATAGKAVFNATGSADISASLEPINIPLTATRSNVLVTN